MCEGVWRCVHGWLWQFILKYSLCVSEHMCVCVCVWCVIVEGVGMVINRFVICSNLFKDHQPVMTSSHLLSQFVPQWCWFQIYCRLQPLNIIWDYYCYDNWHSISSLVLWLCRIVEPQDAHLYSGMNEWNQCKAQYIILQYIWANQHLTWVIL